MRRNILICGGILLILAFAGCQSGTVVPPAARSDQSRKIVTFRPDTAVQDQTLAGAVKLKSLPAIHAAVVLADSASAQALENNPSVLRIEDDPIATAQVYRWPARRARTLSAETLPWGVRSIRADRVWDRNGDLAPDAGADAGGGVKVAVVDTGIDLSHPDLAANIAGGYNAIDPDQPPQDDNGHGTHVAGIIAAAANGAGVVGAAPRASLYAVKVLGSDGSGYYSDIIEGIQWCIDHGMQVINLSLGGYADVQALHDIIAEAARRGITVTAAAGNDGPAPNSVEYPAKYPEVIAVAACDASRHLTEYSSRGPEVALLAPGDDILSTFPEGAYQTLSGTSMAVPHASAAAALVIAAGVSGPDAIRARLRETAGPRSVFRVKSANGVLLDAQRAVPRSPGYRN